jgi:hypothetical protein
VLASPHSQALPRAKRAAETKRPETNLQIKRQVCLTLIRLQARHSRIVRARTSRLSQCWINCGGHQLQRSLSAIRSPQKRRRPIRRSNSTDHQKSIPGRFSPA